MLFLRAKRRGNEFTKESFAALTKAQMARKIGEALGRTALRARRSGEISPANHRCECKLSRVLASNLSTQRKPLRVILDRGDALPMTADLPLIAEDRPNRPWSAALPPDSFRVSRTPAMVAVGQYRDIAPSSAGRRQLHFGTHRTWERIANLGRNGSQRKPDNARAYNPRVVFLTSTR